MSFEICCLLFVIHLRPSHRHDIKWPRYTRFFSRLFTGCTTCCFVALCQSRSKSNPCRVSLNSFFFRLHTFHHSIASSLAPLSAYITRGVGCCCSCSWSEPDNLPYTQHTRPRPLYGMICTHGGVSTMQSVGHNNITTTTTGVWAKWWRAREFVQLAAWCFALAYSRAPLAQQLLSHVACTYRNKLYEWRSARLENWNWNWDASLRRVH